MRARVGVPGRDATKPKSSARDRRRAPMSAARKRVAAAYVVVSCRALASEREGAATPSLLRAFERAREGTLVLDEPGDLDATTQRALLEALERARDGAAKPRVLVTTSRDLEALACA